MNDYQKVLEDFRNHYKKIYEVSLDDEALYFFIRVNELQLSLKRDLSGMQESILKELSDIRDSIQKEFASTHSTLNDKISSIQQSFAGEIKAIPKSSFPKGKDAFLYGLGKSLYPTIVAVLLALFLLGIFIVSQKDNATGKEIVIIKNGKPALKIQDSNHVYFLKLNQ